MTWHGPRMAVTIAALLIGSIWTSSASAHSSTTFSNSLGITLMDGGQATPYPSQIAVSGMTGTLVHTSVLLHGVTADTDDLDVLLESPGGKSVMLESDISMTGSGHASNDDWTFDDIGGITQTDGSTHVYTPGDNDGAGTSVDTGVPTPTGTTLSDLDGDSPNGTWKLYIVDGAHSSIVGSITSWSLTVDTNVPDMTPSPTSHDFGVVSAGSVSSPQNFTLSSDGNSALNITGVHINGPDAAEFAITSDDCTAAILQPDGTCHVGVTFDPASTGAKSASLVIDSNGLQSPQSMALTGTGLAPALAAAPTSLDLGTQTLPVSGVSQAVTLTNTGNATLVFSGAFSLGGANPGDFGLSGSTCVSGLAPGASCSFNVDFTPGSEGAKSAAVSIADNAPGSPHSVSVVGTALAAPQPGPPAPQESGSPDIKVEQVAFSAPPQAGQPTALDVTASDPNEAVTGMLVDFGEALGLYGESACVAGVNKGNTTSFRIPFEFLTPGRHTVTVTVFAGGCGTAQAHTYTFTVDVAAPGVAARRVAHSAKTLSGPNITSKCTDAKLSPTRANTKRILKALLCVMNEQRKVAHLKALRTSKRLTKAALAHSRSMIVGKFFAHQGPREPALSSRLKKVKYFGAAGENIGAGAGPLGTPLAMVNGWMHSSLHKANLLSKKWRAVGIGYLSAYPVPTPALPVATYTTDFGPRT